jgi:hypothetical protein
MTLFDSMHWLLMPVDPLMNRPTDWLLRTNRTDWHLTSHLWESKRANEMILFHNLLDWVWYCYWHCIWCCSKKTRTVIDGISIVFLWRWQRWAESKLERFQFPMVLHYPCLQVAIKLQWKIHR